MPAPLHTTTRALAERHEALWLELTALRTQIAAIALRRPAGPVPGSVRIAAEGLLAEAVPFLRPSREKLPVAAPDYAGLAVQLGQALARLDHWESLRSAWDPARNCHAWVLGDATMPVRRLRPQLTVLPHSGESAESAEIRRQLAARINALTKGLPETGEVPAGG